MQSIAPQLLISGDPTMTVRSLFAVLTGALLALALIVSPIVVDLDTASLDEAKAWAKKDKKEKKEKKAKKDKKAKKSDDEDNDDDEKGKAKGVGKAKGKGKKRGYSDD
jgi:mannitol-specific phosphotransferase system IIBC component